MEGFIQGKVTSKLRGSNVIQNWCVAWHSAEGKLQCIDAARQEQIGESDCDLLSFTVMLGEQGKAPIAYTTKKYRESTEWTLPVLLSNLAAGNYCKLDHKISQNEELPQKNICV